MIRKKKVWRTLTGLLLVIALCVGFYAQPMAAGAAEAGQVTATYLGVYGYGLKDVDILHVDSMCYRFAVNGTEYIYAIANDGNYTIQNQLVAGSEYVLTISNGTIVAAQPTKPQMISTKEYLAMSGTPGVRTLRNFLMTAMMPVGNALYVYGGGWNWQDTGSGRMSTTIGMPYEWTTFYLAHRKNYNYRDGTAASFYPYGGFNEYNYAGLDCSGYLGWALYNTFQTQSGGPGFVTKSTSFAKTLGSYGWGTYTNNVAPAGTVMLPGDIMSIDGHVWISLGTCADGSIVIAHSMPSKNKYGQKGGGVQLSAIGKSINCEAYKIANSYMIVHCPTWHAYYETQLLYEKGYFTFYSEDAGKFSWDLSGANGGLTDPDGIRNLPPNKVIGLLLTRP